MAFIQQNNNEISYMNSSKISAVHAFTTRLGGVSGGIYSSLNLGENTKDAHCNIEENYRRITAALGVPMKSMVFSKQVHKADILEAQYSDARKLFSPIPYDADGLVTDKPNLPLIIFTADCIPVLLHDPVCNAAAAVHCGWRGTVLDIAGKAVRKMQELYGCRAENIRAAIGPGISLCCFETENDVASAVYGILGGEAMDFVFPNGNGKYMVDLKGVNARLLEKAGVLCDNIDVSDECTMCSHDKYWSHRYTKGQRGLQAAIIMLKGDNQ